MLMRICAVIVTYNRPELLVRCVAAVVNQTLRPDAIIVVDNCSRIPAIDALGSRAKELQIFRFSQNTGGAGGFHFGMAEAFRQGFDAAWLMDDDGVPSDSCLMNLVEVAKKTATDVSNPLVVDERSPEKLVFGLTVFGSILSSTAASKAAVNSDGLIEGAINPWNGTLVFRKAYDLLGDIKFECFIWGDEEEYFERARLANLKVGTVTSAVFYHPAAKNQTVKFGLRKSELKLCPPDRSHFYFRNIGFSKMRYRGIVVAIYHGLNYVCFLLKSRQLWEACKFICYYVDGAFDLYLLKPNRSSLLKMLRQVSKVDSLSSTEASTLSVKAERVGNQS
jgi:rhamnopyranosyl-N-acetylglucosaminyl-diphospho-decaprenol beta-1,3/1,4-galactofuranosyltransferase